MKISVIITSYNYEKFLRESIESVLNQTYKEFELIIVDDCSTDSSWDIICEYKSKHPEIITIRHEYNWGTNIVMDTVRNYASGEYIALNSSDDIWEKDKLEKQVEVMKSKPNCVAVFTNARAIDDSGSPYMDRNGFYYELFQTENRTRQEWLRYFFYKGNCLCHPSILIRKDVYAENDFFPKGLKQIPDFVKWIRICKKYEIYVIPDTLLKFRIHDAGKNVSGMRAETQIRSTVELFLMLNEYVAIRDRQEFLKVFPEALANCKEEAFIPEYALARICMQDNLQPYTRLFGINLMYGILNDSSKAKIIEEEYQYTARDFMDENGRYDIFKILPKAFEQMRSIYVDRGEGFQAREVYCQQYTMGEMEHFEWKCEIQGEDGTAVKKLRFDPAEGIMVKVCLHKVMVNEQAVEWHAENALCSKDGMQIFVNLDPIYEISIPEQDNISGNLQVRIEGDIYRLIDDEISSFVSEEMYAWRDMIYCAKAELNDIQNALNDTSNQLKDTQNMLFEAQNELSRIRSTRAIYEEGQADQGERVETEGEEEL